MALAEMLCAGYGTDTRATELVDSLHLYIMPTMNPDGFELGQRSHA
jgi:carboxypeptidase D